MHMQLYTNTDTETNSKPSKPNCTNLHSTNYGLRETTIFNYDENYRAWISNTIWVQF